ncbi:hypothetical protein BH23CHL10_BH23CHL10_06610 [soil metagenome]
MAAYTSGTSPGRLNNPTANNGWRRLWNVLPTTLLKKVCTAAAAQIAEGIEVSGSGHSNDFRQEILRFSRRRWACGPGRRACSQQDKGE